MPLAPCVHLLMPPYSRENIITSVAKSLILIRLWEVISYDVLLFELPLWDFSATVHLLNLLPPPYSRENIITSVAKSLILIRLREVISYDALAA